MAYPRFQLARNFKLIRRGGSNITTASTGNWTNLDTATDITLAAQVGDVIEVGASMALGNQASETFFDVVSVVSAAPVNSFGSGVAVTTAAGGGSPYGVSAWYCQSGVYDNVGGGTVYTITSGDLSAGTTTMRLRYANPATARTIYDIGTGGFAIVWWAKNLGPADPN